MSRLGGVKALPSIAGDTIVAVDAVHDCVFSLQNSRNGIEAGDDEELRADRKEEFLTCGRCGDESPRDE